MWTLLSVFLYVSAAEEACTTCSPPAQSAALLQSSVQRQSKKAAPHMFSPAQMFGPGAKGRLMQSMARRGGRMGPHMGPNMGPHMGPNMGMMGRGPNMPASNFEHLAKKSTEGGSQESSYETGYGGGELTPCSSPSNWLPEKEMYGWCETWNMASQPDEAMCKVDGCRFSWGYCYCETKAGCLAVGAEWKGWSCREEMEGMYYEYLDKVKEAHEEGSCKGKEVWGYKVRDMVAWPASHCCTDYPNTMCEKDVQPMNPCKDQATFLPTAYSYAYCDLFEVNPSKETCEATPECKEEYGYCNCKTKAACESLGGYFWGQTCEQELSYWYPSAHKGVKKALRKGTCEGVEGSWGDLKYQVDYMGHACCESGKSVCEELDNYDSGYSQYGSTGY